MQLQVDDRLADETGNWRSSADRTRTAGGKIAHAHVQSVELPITGELTSGSHYFTGRLTRAQPDAWSSRVMSRWRRSTWRRSAGGGLWVRRRSLPRRSRTTSRPSSAYTCLR